MIHDSQAADEIVALLMLCKQLQSEKDDREWTAPDVNARENQDLADRIMAACFYASMLRQLLPMMSCMSSIGAELERRGEIIVMTGEGYAHKALEYLMNKYLSDSIDTP
ncbi:hypothetical protein DP187_21840 [Enterobacter cloacae]|nr:hypothetical protein DP187_21840 [Enterobacter cloacae]